MNYPSEKMMADKQHTMKMTAASPYSGQILGTGALSQNDAIQPSRPSTEIEGCMSRVNNALDRLHSRVGSVEDRLHPVMRATGPGAQGSSTGVPKEALSPLGDAIRSIEQSIDNAVDRLEVLCVGLAL